MHAHFALDHRLHHHASGVCDPLPASQDFRNNRDRTESAAGPYGPTTGAPGRHRLARDFDPLRPTLGAEYVAASDLRLDGAFVERDSALMYLNDSAVLDSVGTVSYWIKPAFHPEMTGKPRTFLSMDTVKSSAGGYGGWTRQVINGQWFFPSHDAAPFRPSPSEGSLPVYARGPWRPMSFVAGYSVIGGGVGQETDSLNHRTHTHAPRSDYLQAHGWTHVAYCWDMRTHRAHIRVNGRLLPGTSDIRVHPGRVDLTPFFNAPVRLGEPSRTATSMGQARNWSADSTIDEFYMWKGNRLDRAEELFERGRYYRPRAGSEASFTSAAVPLGGLPARVLPPPSDVLRPALSPAPPPMTVSAPRVRIIGAAWTWYGETVRPGDGAPQLRDWSSGRDIAVQVECVLLRNETPTGAAMTRDGGEQCNVSYADADTAKYRIVVRTGEPGAILLATPVLDDVTLFFTRGVEFVLYEVAS